jgi:hypothetical protein
MERSVSEPARRTLLKKGLIGAAAATAVIATGGRANAAVIAPSGNTLKLVGQGFHAFTGERVGVLPSKGDAYSVYGELVDASGVKVGDFMATCTAIDSPFEITGQGVGSIETQTLNLREGSIIGMGAGTGATRAYAIVGGTGKYAGARGSYTATIDTYGLGGSGAAAFEITLSA